MTKPVVATVQVRMNSGRLPGKALLEVGGMPALELLVQRLKKVQSLNAIIIATTDSPDDDRIINAANRLNVLSYRGSEHDVLERVCRSLSEFGPDTRHVECFGDSPLIDFGLIEKGISTFSSMSDAKIYTTAENSGFPSGNEFNIYHVELLRNVQELIPLGHGSREYVGYNVRRFTDKRNIYREIAKGGQFAPEYQFEIDEIADYKYITELLDGYQGEQIINLNLEELISLAKRRNQLKFLNHDVVRRWKKISF